MVLLNLLLSLGFLLFLAQAFSFISRVNSLSQQLDRISATLAQAEEAEKRLEESRTASRTT